MKGISIAIETIIYLILGVTVLSIALFFFLTQAGPAQDQIKLETDRNNYCGSYVSIDFTCSGGTGPGGVKPGVTTDLLTKLGKACGDLKRAAGFAFNCDGSAATIECIRTCCITCPQYASKK